MFHESENTRAVSVRELPDAHPGWSRPSGVNNKQQPSTMDIEAAPDTFNPDTFALRHVGDSEIIWRLKGTMDLNYLSRTSESVLQSRIAGFAPCTGYMHTCRSRCASYLVAIKPVTLN